MASTVTTSTSTPTSMTRSIQRANQAAWIRESGPLVEAVAQSMARALVRRTMHVVALETTGGGAQSGLTRADRRSLCRSRLDDVARRGMPRDQWLASLAPGSSETLHAGGETHVQRLMQRAAASVRSLVDASIDEFIATTFPADASQPGSSRPTPRTRRKAHANV